MGVCYALAGEKTNLFVSGESTVAPILKPFDYNTGVPLASDRTRIDSAAFEHIKLLLANRLCMPAHGRLKLGNLEIANRYRKFQQVEFLALALLVSVKLTR